MIARRRTLGIAALALVASLGAAGCAGTPEAAPAACPPALIDLFTAIGAEQTDAPDAAIYPDAAPAVSCSFYFAPQESTSIVITEADQSDFDAVASALEAAGYELGERVENHDPAPGDAHLQVPLEGGPATGVLMLTEPDPEAGFDSISVVMLAVPTA